MSNDLLSIPCVLMRGGTSKGPFFLASDLPADTAQRDRLLLEVMGSGHPLQIDGIGGGNALTSKVAIIDRSSRDDADVDYLFAQVRVEQQVVDTSPNCGNMLAAVGPYAIERGLVQAQDPQTSVRIFNVNTGKLIVATVETPGGEVVYRGDTRIAGAPGSASPVRLSFLDAAGARTGKLLPSGHAQETIDGVAVSLVDCAMPMMLVRAEDLGVRGDAAPAELNADAAFLARLEALRIEAGARMGIADAGNKVIPKPVLLSAPQHGGHLQVRYFMPPGSVAPLAFYFQGDLLGDYSNLELIGTISTMEAFQKIYRPEIYNANSVAGKVYQPSLKHQDYSSTRIVYDREERSQLAVKQGRFTEEHFIKPYRAVLEQWAAR